VTLASPGGHAVAAMAIGEFMQPQVDDLRAKRYPMCEQL
jgi:hypothetical protein